MTIQNLGTKTEVLNVLPSDVVTTTGVGSAIDLLDYEGDIAVSLDAEAGGSGITYAVKLTQCDTSGGTYTDVSGGGFTTSGANAAVTEKISVNTDSIQRFIKASVTVAGGTGAGAISVVAFGSKKYG